MMRLLLCLLLALAAAPHPLGAYDARVRYVGRFDRRDPHGPRCDWAGSQVRLAFEGTTLHVEVAASSDKGDYLGVVVDGVEQAPIKIMPDTKSYIVAQNLTPGRHVVTLVKRTEPLVDTLQFLGFQSDGKFLTPPAEPHRRIEVIGDSISCGYGNEATSKEAHFARSQENNWETYEAMAARAVGADYTCIAWSGRTMYPDDTMPSIYDRTLASDASSQWDFSWVPEAVVINLCTNDFRNGPPDKAEWTAAYLSFIQHVRVHYPHAHIFCTVGSMMTDTWPPDGHHLTIVRGYLKDVVSRELQTGDENVSFLELPEQQAEDGYGADWHPSVKTHRKMAQALVAALGRELGWREVAPVR